MPEVALFDILQVIETKYMSEFANPKGWLKDTLLSDFDWLGQRQLLPSSLQL
jgi:hypothetical protein